MFAISVPFDVEVTFDQYRESLFRQGRLPIDPERSVAATANVVFALNEKAVEEYTHKHYDSALIMSARCMHLLQEVVLPQKAKISRSQAPPGSFVWEDDILPIMRETVKRVESIVKEILPQVHKQVMVELAQRKSERERIVSMQHEIDETSFVTPASPTGGENGDSLPSSEATEHEKRRQALLAKENAQFSGGEKSAGKSKPDDAGGMSKTSSQLHDLKQQLLQDSEEARLQDLEAQLNAVTADPRQKTTPAPPSNPPPPTTAPPLKHADPVPVPRTDFAKDSHLQSLQDQLNALQAERPKPKPKEAPPVQQPPQQQPPQQPQQQPPQQLPQQSPQPNGRGSAAVGGTPQPVAPVPNQPSVAPSPPIGHQPVAPQMPPQPVQQPPPQQQMTQPPPQQQQHVAPQPTQQQRPVVPQSNGVSPGTAASPSASRPSGVQGISPINRPADALVYQRTRSWAFPRFRASQGRRGLVNLGNTCYLNSVLQCMGATLVGKYFRTDQYLSSVVDRYTGGGRVVEGFTYVMRELILNEPYAVSASQLKIELGKKNESFAGQSQQDANELLQTLVDAVHEDVNLNSKMRPNMKEIECKGSDAELSEKFLAQYKARNRSVLVDLMAFQERSMIQCPKCNRATRSFSTLMSVQLPIPIMTRAVSVEDCLAAYCTPEVLDASSLYACDGCKSKVRATKQLTFFGAPNVLVITLKRFRSYGNFADKINVPVMFQPTLDLTPFSTLEEGKSAQYTLVGVVNHQGNMHGGHYTADVKGAYDGAWYYCSDDVVKPSTSPNFNLAYMLFYVKDQR